MTEQRETTRIVRENSGQHFSDQRRSGFFIAIDGIDGCGKSTQAKRLAAACQRAGIENFLVQDPGTTEVGKELRRLLLNKDFGMAAITQALLFAAARHETCLKVEQALKDGLFVIADRWTPSTIVYQGIAQGVPKALIKELTKAPICFIQPDVLAVLIVDKRTAQARRAADKADRFEGASDDFKQALESGFRKPQQYREGREWINLYVDQYGEEQVEETIRKLLPHGIATMLPPVAIPTVTGNQIDPNTISHRLV